jgi:hypothetical protein
MDRSHVYSRPDMSCYSLIRQLLCGCACLCNAAFAMAAAESAPDQEPSSVESFCSHKPADPDVYFRLPCVDDAYDAYEKFMATSPVRLGLGAYHWFNIQRKTGEISYGFPTLPGTYFYYANIDIDNTVYPDQLQKFGFHTQARYRDQSLFRTFFANRTWLYESYAWLDTPLGTVETGKVKNRIGFDWDNSFWGNVPYFDGYKLDPDYGVSLEKTWKFNDRFSMESYQQFFFAEDNVNGSFNSDAESAPGYDENRTYVVRLAPRWSFTKDLSLGGGITGFHQNIENHIAIPLPNGSLLRHNEKVNGYALDLNVRVANLSVLGEVIQAFGIRSSMHYATGGASDESKNFYIGANYDFGPLLLIGAYSRGEYENPRGKQDLYVVETHASLTKYLTLILGYVYWTAQPAHQRHTELQDGFQIAIIWSL